MKNYFESLNSRLTLYSHKLNHLTGHYLHLFCDNSGKLLGIMDRWKFQYHSIVDELESCGTLVRYFGLSPAIRRKMAELPLLSMEGKGPGGRPLFLVLPSLKNLTPRESPEAFYSAIPTAVLYMYRLDARVFYGCIRIIPFLPNISPQRPNGILFIDPGDRLVGFNETFHGFFKNKYAQPEKLLNRPVAEFLDPAPSRIQNERLQLLQTPSRAALPVVFKRDFTETPSIQGIVASERSALAFGPDGLVFTNSTREHLSITLPVEADLRDDFSMEMDFKPLGGGMPLFAVGAREAPADEPDAHGYLIGPDFSRSFYQVKRKGLAQKIGGRIRAGTVMNYVLHKRERALILEVNGEQQVAFYDFNFLFLRKGRVSILMRVDSVCAIRQISFSARPRAEARPDPEPPMTRLKTTEQQAFILNPVDSMALSSNAPGTSAYVLENITEMHRQIERLRTENRMMLWAAGKASDAFVGSSPKLLRIKETAARVAATDATILIQGETGTGKEVLARFVHDNSPGKEGPFVKVDCSVIPKELMESELFGHEKGAFTGASEKRIGLLEKADLGTLFLDEVGGLSPAAQAKLLHFMQDHTLLRVGGRDPVRLNLRIVAAANRPLKKLVEMGAFREDLYYRMEVITLELPPLRERMEDAAELCRHFIMLFNARHHRNIRDLSPGAYEKVFSHSWPGNVRELGNAVERAVILCDEEMVAAGHLDIEPKAVLKGKRAAGKKGRPLKKVGIEEIRGLFGSHGGVASKVAAELGVSPRALYYKIKGLGAPVGGLREGGVGELTGKPA